MSRDTSFYYSFLVLPPSKRKAIIAVWDFCRAVDDAVDEAVPEYAQGGSMSRALGSSRSIWRLTALTMLFSASPPSRQPTVSRAAARAKA